MFGRFATRKHEAAYPQLWQGRIWCVCPSVTGPTGLNVYDLSGYNKPGTIAVQTAPNAWVRSQGKAALLFNASGRDCVNAGTSAGVVDYDFSACIWVRKLATTSAYSNIWGLCRWNTGASAGTNEWNLLIGNGESGSGDLPTSAVEIGSTITTLTGTTAIPLNQWCHVAIVRRGTSFTQWLDGKQNGSATCGSGAIVNRSRNLKIGDSDISSDLGNNAQFDDAAVYNRALGAGEIRLLATRRGIAYEPRRDVFGSTAKPYLYGRNTVIGSGVY